MVQEAFTHIFSKNKSTNRQDCVCVSVCGGAFCDLEGIGLLGPHMNNYQHKRRDCKPYMIS